MRARRAWAAACMPALLGLGAAQAQAQEPALSYEAARVYVLDRSDALAAAQAGVQAKDLQAEGLKRLGGPVLSLGGTAYAYNLSLGLDLSALNQRVEQLEQRFPPLLQGMLAGLPALPSSYTLRRRDEGANASVSALWPIYMGGAADAARGVVQAQGDEARADAQQAGLEAEAQLAQRYFGAQLARRAADLRARAAETVAQHDQAAQKMLAAGVISRVERLQALAASEDARRQAAKAEDDAQLAATALARSLRVQGAVRPATPLFVLSQPIEPLDFFVEQALARHPGLAKVAAKKQQAEQLHAGEEALRRPHLVAFGTRELRSGSADWVAGLSLRWTLYDAVNRDALAAASLKQVEQAQHTGAQARTDIALLVERHWRAVENARRHFLALQSGEDLALEMQRLRVAGLREGTSTTLDLIDAETNLAKVRTERAQAANDYVQALAQLLGSAGLSERLPDYIARADIRLDTP